MARRSSSRIVSAGLVLIALLLAVFVSEPLRTEVGQLTQEVSTSEAELALLEAEIASLMDLETTLPQAESEREQLLASVPVGLNQDDLIEDFTVMAKKAGVSLNSLSFALQSSESGKAQVVSISTNLTGDYSALNSLLESLETHDRLFSVQSLGVQLGEVTESGYTMTFSLSVNAYYQP